jgi:hypothetical protein
MVEGCTSSRGTKMAGCDNSARGTPGKDIDVDYEITFTNEWDAMGLRRFVYDRAWGLVAMGAAALAGIATRKALDAGWHLVQDEDPPEDPASRGVGWGQAVLWTVATSAAIGVAQLVARRGAAAGWRKVRGRYPEGMG